MARLNLWLLSRLDPYKFVRPFLFALGPEQAHTIALKLLTRGFGPKIKNDQDPILHTSVCGLEFPNPIGVAAGFDKNAEAIAETLQCGFGFMEAGTITLLAQKGNPKPRLFRSVDAQAVINRLGFNGNGMDAALRHIAAWHDASRVPSHDGTVSSRRGILGINIGKNRNSTNAIADYLTCFRLVEPYADYVTVNISSPNTPGLRDLQAREALAGLLRQLAAARAESARKPPIFVKIAPDLTDAQQEDIAAAVLEHGMQGLVIGNTTVARNQNLPADFAREAGGLSGRPLFEPSTAVLANMYRLTEGKIPLIAAGGVFSGADAYAKIRSGASLVQLYTALVFEGPGLARRITRDLATLLRRDGFASVKDAVGAKGTA